MPKYLTADDFDSEAELIYYQRNIIPGLKSKKIKRCELHKEFTLLPPIDFHGKHIRAKVFKPDFVLTMADDSICVIEVKSSFVRKSERDYSLRRHLFLMNFCIPNNWDFIEVNADEIMLASKQLKKIGKIMSKNKLVASPVRKASISGLGLGPATTELLTTYGPICLLGPKEMKTQTNFLHTQNESCVRKVVIAQTEDGLVLADEEDNVYLFNKKLKALRFKTTEYVLRTLMNQLKVKT